KRQDRAEPGSLHSWQRSDSTLRFVVETDDRWVVGVLHFRQRNLERQCVTRIETRIDVLESGETFNEKPRAAEQYQRERDFGDNQSVAQTIAPRAYGRTSATLLECLSELRP